MMITTLAHLKARLKQDEFDPTDDALLTSMILHCGERFERECNRKFERTAGATFEFNADDREIVPLRFPIESVAGFDLKSSEAEGWVAQTDVDYLIRRAGETPCLISLAAALGGAEEVGRVTYTGGYVMPGGTVGSGQTAFPDSLEQAAIEQCVAWWLNKDRKGLASISGQGGSVAANPVSIVTPKDLLPEVMNLLRTFTRWTP